MNESTSRAFLMSPIFFHSTTCMMSAAPIQSNKFSSFDSVHSVPSASFPHAEVNCLRSLLLALLTSCFYSPSSPNPPSSLNLPWMQLELQLFSQDEVYVGWTCRTSPYLQQNFSWWTDPASWCQSWVPMLNPSVTDETDEKMALAGQRPFFLRAQRTIIQREPQDSLLEVSEHWIPWPTMWGSCFH